MGLEDIMAQLDAAGISTQTLADIGSSAFYELLAQAGGDIGQLIELIQNYGSQDATATVSADTSEAQEGLDNIDEGVEEVDGENAQVGVEADTDQAQTDIDDTGDKLDDLNGDSATVKVKANTSDFYSAVSGVRQELRNLDGSSATVHIYKQTHEGTNASGGVFGKQIIPRNAAGALNGIVTRATLSNIGWVGEAGAEAIMHMRNAGGAVVPLSNKRYVRPFARAVASEMNGPQRVMNVSLSLNYKAGDDAQQMARDIVTNLENMMNMEA